MPHSPLIEAIFATARETRAASVIPGTERERAWHQLVPNPEHRAPAQRPSETPSAPKEDVTPS
jgi:hypothetical protein